MESEEYNYPHQIPEHFDIESESNLGQGVKNNRENRIRKRVHQLAPKMMLKDNFEEENSADDSSKDSHKDGSSNVLGSPSSLLSNNSLKGPAIQKDIVYKAEFYRYIWSYENEYIAELHKTIMKHNPIFINPSARASKSTNTSCFDVTSMYAIPNEIIITDDAITSEAVLAELGTYITIRSRFLLDYLKHVVLYYPTVSFDTEELLLEEPFCVLLHYRQELREHRDLAGKATSELGSTDGGDSSIGLEHLTALSNYLEQRYADALSRELLRHQGFPAMCTYEWVWLLFKPGSIVYSWADGVLEAFVVQEHDRQERKDRDFTKIPRNIRTMDDLESTPRSESLCVTVWYQAFNGERLGRCREKYDIPKFDGEKPITSLPIFPHEFMKHDKRVHESLSTQDYLIYRGQLYFEMTRRSYRHYEGDTANLPKRNVSPTLDYEIVHDTDIARSGEGSWLIQSISSTPDTLRMRRLDFPIALCLEGMPMKPRIAPLSPELERMPEILRFTTPTFSSPMIMGIPLRTSRVFGRLRTCMPTTMVSPLIIAIH